MKKTLSITDRADLVIEDFEFLDGWEERYNHIISLGRTLPTMPGHLINNITKVKGCASQVWMLGEVQDSILNLQASSDAAIVSGLIAILVYLFNDVPIEEAKNFDTHLFFDKIGLSSSLSAQRANGLAAMVNRLNSTILSS